jgi:purine-binding chemotaxis protein CheW
MTSPSQQSGFRVCLFELAGQHFGLRLSSVSEVVPMAALSRPPSMPSLLEGFLNLRGTSLAVLRTAAVLGLPQISLELHTPLVIVRGQRLPLALLVNRVLGVASVAGLMPVAESDSFNGCVEGRLTADGHDINLLSLDRLLLAKEQQVLEQFQATETHRLGQLEARPS